jgi:hypothetical protein
LLTSMNTTPYVYTSFSKVRKSIAI